MRKGITPFLLYAVGHLHVNRLDWVAVVWNCDHVTFIITEVAMGILNPIQTG
ncbi:hypothetical protein H1164_15775 [Thermoactinomyces daqus]|uniref:Uncharacterized protein n=1 Tax=Thermoactinomyces daqus TaxID=1329516 RepID=A0A7W1XCS9_9BACL|nr:hypothetical protein [Thermoactinomyces daqus]MBA4544311.1 hypothetical protein [Thermoactinomyces daqus]